MDRMQKVNEQLKREISAIVHQELGDPRLQFVSITGVSTSRDLRQAKVFFSILGDEKKIEDAKKALASAGGLIRKIVGQRITMRYNPALFFTYDDSIAYGAHIEKTLKELGLENE